jgi:NADH-quinone oxidoreductase subunit N
MSFIQNIIPIAAELWLLISASFILLLGAVNNQPRRTQFLTQMALFIALGINVGYFSAHNTLYAWNDLFVSNALANLLKIGCTTATLLTLHYGQRYASDREIHHTEFYVLSITALIGQMLMLSANHLLTVYLGLELMSLSLYALVALRRDHTVSTEAAIKYFVLGAMASGFLLYGISMLYGATGSLDLATIFKVLSFGGEALNRPTAVLASVFIVAGLAFKFGLVPFHMWVPDVYEGSPTVVTLLIASAPKLAILGLALRLMVQGMLPLSLDWQPMFLFLGLSSIAFGNVVAVMQTSFKRMLAYSTISHVGFVCLALSVGVVGIHSTGDANLVNASKAYGAAVFYMLTYVLTTLVSFGIILFLSKKGFECDSIIDLKGLSKHNPLLALTVLIVMCSLAGLPPLVGFWAKLAVLDVLLAANYNAVAVAVVLFSLIGVFYYLRVLKTVFFDTDSVKVTPHHLGEQSVAIETSTNNARLSISSILFINALAVVILGFFPSKLMNLVISAVNASLPIF